MRPRNPLPRLALAAAALTLLIAACEGEATPAPAAHPLAGGVLATFDAAGEHFKVWVTNPQTIQQLLDLRDGKSQASIPNGRIHRGPGQASHNAPYGWHLDPEDIAMAEITMELCDGAPHYVEQNTGEFVDTVKRYCPWSARLVALEDFRG